MLRSARTSHSCQRREGRKSPHVRHTSQSQRTSGAGESSRSEPKLRISSRERLLNATNRSSEKNSRMAASSPICEFGFLAARARSAKIAAAARKRCQFTLGNAAVQSGRGKDEIPVLCITGLNCLQCRCSVSVSRRWYLYRRWFSIALGHAHRRRDLEKQN
jgi:hypothetical protein